MAVLNRGLEARFCNAPAAVSSSDVNIHQVAYNALGENPDYSVDSSQPFPIYGFLNVGWVPNRVVVNPLAPFALIISNPTDGESFGPARNNQGAAGLSTDPINFRASAVGLPSESLEWTDNGVHLGSGPSSRPLLAPARVHLRSTLSLQLRRTRAATLRRVALTSSRARFASVVLSRVLTKMSDGYPRAFVGLAEQA